MMPLPEDQRELLRKPLPRLYEKGVWATLRRGCSHQKECHVGRKEPSRRFLGLRQTPDAQAPTTMANPMGMSLPTQYHAPTHITTCSRERHALTRQSM